MIDALKKLNEKLQGELHYDRLYCALYAQDASVYQQQPIAVCLPKIDEDIARIITFAQQHGCSIIPRAGGTSLAGQLVGKGIVIDTSKYYRRIITIDVKRQSATIQAGVIRSDLNKTLKQHNLFFAPETSTTDSCTIGGMVGNNACGTRSVYYGTTREHILSIKGFLSDARPFHFCAVSEQALSERKKNEHLEGHLYRQIDALITDYKATIENAQPDKSLIRHNSGYALNALLNKGEPLNLSRLLCGSEGTLAIITEIEIKLTEVPAQTAIICAHFHSLCEAFAAIPAILADQPTAIELFDRPTLNASKKNSLQSTNRFWIEGDPDAVLVIECIANDEKALKTKLSKIAYTLRERAYALPSFQGDKMRQVWDLRKASLGLLMGEKGNKKAVAVIEDAAIPIAHLNEYVQEMQAFAMQKDIELIVYGHASVGVIHMRPKLDLDNANDRLFFQQIAHHSAKLVKQLNGSISGEHGDGRLRSQWLSGIHGDDYHRLMVKVKHLFDPNNLLNPGKITQVQELTKDFRPAINTKYDKEAGFKWDNDMRFSAAIQKCNGSGACRKSDGIMCPSFQATQEELLSTRGRANLLRHVFSAKHPENLFNNPVVQEALDSCLSCKACKTECPASVDMAKIKAEFLSLRASKNMLTKLEKRQRFAVKHFPRLLQLQSKHPIFNRIANRLPIKKTLGVDGRRNFPHVVKPLQSKWHNLQQPCNSDPFKSVGLIVDLYSNFHDPHIATAAVKVLNKLGYVVTPLFLEHSPRLLINTGLLSEATQTLLSIKAKMAKCTVTDWIGIEPSETLVFKDDCIDLIGDALPKVSLLDEFLHNPLSTHKALKAIDATVHLHTHCHQRALSKCTAERMLNNIPNLKIKHIESSCCGMAGQFGYQQFDLSKKIAENGILKYLKTVDSKDMIATSGTSCRHQFIDLSKHRPTHPIELVLSALS